MLCLRHHEARKSSPLTPVRQGMAGWAKTPLLINCVSSLAAPFANGVQVAEVEAGWRSSPGASGPRKSLRVPGFLLRSGQYAQVTAPWSRRLEREEDFVFTHLHLIRQYSGSSSRGALSAVYQL